MLLSVLEHKLELLEKKELDEIDERFSFDALRILKSRYLQRFNDGRLETPKELFERVAITITLADIVYDQIVSSLEFCQPDHEAHVKDAKHYLSSIAITPAKKIGQYTLNEHHLDAMVRAYIGLAKDGRTLVTFSNLLWRIDNHEFDQYEHNIKSYYELMVNQVFLPNTPTLMNAGTQLGQCSACFVLDMEDSLDDIFDTVKDVAMIFKSGGGVGINYSKLRSYQSPVGTTGGNSSGVLSFMKIVDSVTDVVKQAAKRRGANMGILDVSHPEIREFIKAKSTPHVLENFNVSVGLYESFWKALEEDKEFELVDPHTKKVTDTVMPNDILNSIATNAWQSAEPGLVFFDNANKYNPILDYKKYPMRSTNPCSEIVMYEYDSCVLGSINLTKFVVENEFDWNGFANTILMCTQFLDNVIDINKYTLDEIEKESKLTRRIGLGIMGLAHSMYQLGIPYNSKEGFDFMEKVCYNLTKYSMMQSAVSATQRGSFEIYNQSDYFYNKLPLPHNNKHADITKFIKNRGLRNCWTTTIAPTGTISMIADCSSGLEPEYGLVFEKKVVVGNFRFVNNILKEKLAERNIELTDELIEKINNNKGSVQGIDEIPKEIQNVFLTAMDIHWSDHVMAQAKCQKWITNAISKTINMNNNVSINDVKYAYLMAHELGCKGLSIYRDGSRHTQVLSTGTIGEGTNRDYNINPNTEAILDDIKKEYVDLETFTPIPTATFSQKDDKCPNCRGTLIFAEGCVKCLGCAYTACTV
jgi:ribonucleoside-diphosphate reductase alpha chain